MRIRIASRLKRELLLTVAALSGLAGALLPATHATAQTYPTRTVTLIIPFAAGSGSDVVARILTARMSEVLGQQVIIENVGGAGGMIGASRGAKSNPDGYTLLLGGVDTMAQNQTLYKKPLYNALTDFEPVGLASEQAIVLVVRKELPVKTLSEFATYLKANGGKMQYASSGAGSASHLTCLQLTTMLGGTAAHVPYRGSAPALQDLIAGTIDYFCALSAVALPQITAKSMTPIVTMTGARTPFLPDLPTVQEAGFPAIDAYFWSGFFMPAGAPTEAIGKINSAIAAALDTPAVQKRLGEVGTTIVTPERRSPAYLKSFVASELAKWAVTIKASGVSLD